MNKQLFEHYLSQLAQPVEDLYQVIPLIKPCAYCGVGVKCQVITAEVYRLGSPHAHFKHKCGSCKNFVFEGKAKACYISKSYKLPPKTPRNTGNPRGRPRKQPMPGTLAPQVTETELYRIVKY